MAKTLKQTGCNSLCGNCLRSCKQADTTLLLDCPRFLKRPFKVAVHRFDQLDLFAGDKK
ncbi:hypothetical protein [Trichloromonas sp.]|uniref:hypothetical protein n=1 Tax=Trichloromonas sp. TaxID=3069249 RepID=UPI003D816BA1